MLVIKFVSNYCICILTAANNGHSTMSTQYKITTKIPSFGFTRFYGGKDRDCCLSIHKYVSYNENYNCEYTYKEVLVLKQDMIKFLRDNKDRTNVLYTLTEDFVLSPSQLKTIITDLHIYLYDNIHK